MKPSINTILSADLKVNFVMFLFACSLLQSCTKSDEVSEPTIDHFTYSDRYDWKEDSVLSSDNNWIKVEKGHTFSLLSTVNDINKSSFGVYPNLNNIKTNFYYSIAKDSVFAIKHSADSILFLDANQKVRKDLYGVLQSSNTSLIIYNKGVTPNISIKYELQNK